MKISIKKLNQQGVTLIELLVVMGLLSGMLVVLASIFTAAADVQRESRAYSATLSNGQFIMSRLNYDIARASAITTPGSLGTTSSSLVLTIGGNAYTYDLSGSNFQLTDNVGTDNLNSNDVSASALNFQELGNTGGKPTISYSFTITSTAVSAGGPDTQTFNSAAGLR
jgi:type II secretory pathway pseudopilin PulG